MNTGKCIAPIISYCHQGNRDGEIFECGDSNNCPEYFNQDNGIYFNYPWGMSKVAAMHHYGCECMDCIEFYRRMKSLT